MRVLNYGAGVIGSVFAGHLHQAGNDVTILARGARFADLRKRGLILLNGRSGEVAYHHIPVTESIEPHEAFDLTIVAVRKNQVDGVLPALADRNLGNILFLVNNATGYQQWADAVGRDRVRVGFPGVGGTVQDGVVRYELLPRWLQPTTIGELDGRITSRLKSIASVLRDAGFPVALCRNMDAWQKTHVAIVSPIANAIYMVGGSAARLAQRPDAARLVVLAIREGFRVLSALNIPITPAPMRVVSRLPESLLVRALRRWAKTPQFETVVVAHAKAAVSEMRTLADEFKDMASLTKLRTPAIDELRRFVPVAEQRAAAA